MFSNYIVLYYLMHMHTQVHLSLTFVNIIDIPSRTLFTIKEKENTKFY